MQFGRILPIDYSLLQPDYTPIEKPTAPTIEYKNTSKF